MCGIAGITFGIQTIQAEHIVEHMLAKQLHRGPEGCGVDRLADAVFGCCRLSFVDISTSTQPYCSPDGRILLVFNGEIYNHIELRQRLGAAHPCFTTPGEAALLAALYAEHGLEMVHMLNGMFAIAIFDVQRSETILIRDRFGKKPLYYTVIGRQVVFASELRALQAHPQASVELDVKAVGLYLTFNTVPSPASLIRGIHKVPASSVVRIRDGHVCVESYWQLRLAPEEHPREETLEGLHQRLRNAVVMRLPQEVPFGVFLSGGLDSSLIAAIAARVSSTPLRTYSVGFPDHASFDETSHALAIANALQVKHSVVPITLDALASEAKRCLTRMDEPVADQSLVPTYLLAVAARREVKAVLTGDGADEMLMGYQIFLAMTLLRAATRILPAQTLQRVLRWLGQGQPSDRNLHYAHVARLLARALSEPPHRQYYSAACAVPPTEWDGLFQPQRLTDLMTVDPFVQVDAFVSQSPGAGAAEQLQLGMICHFLRDVILTKLDRATMLASLEARSPYLDHALVDMCLQLPSQLKLNGLTTKYALKQLALRYLPERYVQRRKQGFRTPTAALLRGPLLEFTRDMLSARTLREDGLFRPNRVQQLFDEHVARVQDHHRSLWAILCLQSWLHAAR